MHGKDFQSMRAKARAGRLVSPASQSDTSASLTPKAADVYGNLKPQQVRSTVTRENVSHVEPGSQQKYGSHREKIRRVMPGWGTRGR